MAEKRVRYQAVWTGKLYDSEEEAMRDTIGPVQVVIQGVDRFPKKGFFGTKVWR